MTTSINHAQSKSAADHIGGLDYSPTTTVSNMTFTIAVSDSGGDDGRWNRVGDHLAAWLIAEWEREQQGGTQESEEHLDGAA
jgi:hypothetical protein